MFFSGDTKQFRIYKVCYIFKVFCCLRPLSVTTSRFHYFLHTSRLWSINILIDQIAKQMKKQKQVYEKNVTKLQFELINTIVFLVVTYFSYQPVAFHNFKASLMLGIYPKLEQIGMKLWLKAFPLPSPLEILTHEEVKAPIQHIYIPKAPKVIERMRKEERREREKRRGPGKGEGEMKEDQRVNEEGKSIRELILLLGNQPKK